MADNPVEKDALLKNIDGLLASAEHSIRSCRKALMMLADDPAISAAARQYFIELERDIRSGAVKAVQPGFRSGRWPYRDGTFTTTTQGVSNPPPPAQEPQPSPVDPPVSLPPGD